MSNLFVYKIISEHPQSWMPGLGGFVLDDSRPNNLLDGNISNVFAVYNQSSAIHYIVHKFKGRKVKFNGPLEEFHFGGNFFTNAQQNETYELGILSYEKKIDFITALKKERAKSKKNSQKVVCV